MSKGRKTKKGWPDGGERSFGSGLDEVDWKPRSGTSRLKSRANKTSNDSRRNYERALNALVAEGQFGGPNHISTELEILEEATRLVKQACEKAINMDGLPQSVVEVEGRQVRSGSTLDGLRPVTDITVASVEKRTL